MIYLQQVVTLQYFPEKCSGCGRCIEVCPRNVFTLENRKAVITDRDLCIECGACQNNCQFGALSVNSGVGCAAALINSLITGGEPSCGCSGSDEACCDSGPSSSVC
ncbi:MAG: mercury methylation ferredoxin HgcB [Spirochaetota bacterium]